MDDIEAVIVMDDIERELRRDEYSEGDADISDDMSSKRTNSKLPVVNPRHIGELSCFQNRI